MGLGRVRRRERQGGWGEMRERQKEVKAEGCERDGERQGWRGGSLDGDWGVEGGGERRCRRY